MRTPRRDFSVEYKNSRRRPVAQPKSIWGNLDLRAVARAVEADGTLQAPVNPERAVVHEKDMASGVIASGMIPAASTAAIPETTTQIVGAASLRPAPPAEAEAVSQQDMNDGDAVRSEAQTAVPDRRSRSKSIRPRKKRQAMPPHLRPALDDTDGRIGEAGSAEELAYLVKENRQLKRLLVVRLQTENDRLKSMLRRFGAL